MPRKRGSPSSISSRKPASVGLANFGRFCGELRTEDGSTFKLHPFQKTMLRDYFEGVRETALIIPKKNGKSTLLAALALYHLLTVENAECIMVAASREQAEIILRQSRMFLRQSPPLQRIMQAHRRDVTSLIDEGRIRVLASDEDTADGTIPTLAIVDELHRHRTADLYGVLRDGLGPVNGQIITISTAASTLDSPLGRIRQAAYETPGFTRTGKHNYARSKTRSFHEWCLLPTDDTSNLRVVKQANPAPWNTVEWLGERKESATPAQWLRFACGIWTESEEPWVEPHVWDGLSGKVTIPNAADVVLSVKVRGSSAAIVAVHVGKLVEVLAWTWDHVPTFRALEAKVRELAERWTVKVVLYDPRAFKRSAELLDSEGYPLAEFPHTAERMSAASGTLQKLIEEDQLRHSGAPDFRAQVLAGVWKESERGRVLGEDPVSKRPVDALIALAAGVHVAGEPKKPPREVAVARR